MPSKRKKNEARKAKSKSQDCCVTFKPKNYVEILLSAHARTSQADVLHLAQKAVKRTTCKTVCAVIPSLNRASITSEYIEI